MSGGQGHVETAQPGGIGEDFPARAWPDMVALYGGAGIRELCGELQDVFDADIPLLLFLALADRAGMSADALHLEALTRSAAEWRVAAVKPLRALRTTLLESCRDPAESAFLDKIKHMELEAERLEVDRLARAFLPSTDAGRSLTALYLSELCVPSHHAAAARARIDAALAAMPTRMTVPSGSGQPNTTSGGHHG